MSDTYKLVFRGEVLDGQHPAVVRKRLAEAAGFADDALDKLFSGRPVVVKRQADTATAARLQGVFKKAGARLRVLPVDSDDEQSAPPTARPASGRAGGAADPAPATAAGPAADTDAGGFDLLPAGSDILREAERTPFEPRDVDTGGLKLEGARFAVADPEPAEAGPDVSHLSLAATGSDLSDPRPPPEHVVSAPPLDVADAGADLGPERGPVTPAVDLEKVAFEVAPAGSDMGQRTLLAPPPPPDVSHLSVDPES